MKLLRSISPLTLSLLFLLLGFSYAQAGTSIVAIVNDEPITNFDIDMRIKLYLANSNDFRKKMQARLKQQSTQDAWRKMVEEEMPQSREEAKKLQGKLVKRIRRQVAASMKKGLRKKILKELINERIQLQQASKLGVALTDEELNDRLDKIAGRNKNKRTGKPLTRKEFSAGLKKMGIPVREFRNRMKAKGSWVRVVRRKFQYQVNIGDQDVDRLINTSTGKNGKKQTVFKLQRVRLKVSANASQSSKAKGLARAEKLRQSVTSCKSLKKAVGRVSGASLKSMGEKPASSFPHTLQMFLNNTSEGHLTPPTLTSSGIELYAVCGRKQRSVADPNKRKAVKEKLRQEEFQVLARRHLQDLRQEASIVYR